MGMGRYTYGPRLRKGYAAGSLRLKFVSFIFLLFTSNKDMIERLHAAWASETD